MLVQIFILIFVGIEISQPYFIQQIILRPNTILSMLLKL